MIVIVVMLVTIMVVMMMVLTGALAMEFAMALIMPTNPLMVIAPMPAYKHPFVAFVPIARTIGVIDPIIRIQINRDPDCLGAWPNQHADRQENHC